MHEPFNASDHLLRAAAHPHTAGRIAITGPGGEVTYQELARRAGALAAGLQASGVRPEERVVLFMADGPDMAAAILAAMKMGAVPVPLSTMMNGAELALLLRDTRTRLLLYSERFVVAAEAAMAQCPGVRMCLVGELSGDGAPAPYETWDDSPALWLYTSGTTGTPKGAMHRHANIRHVVETYALQVLGITEADRCFSVPRLFFAYGLGSSLFFPLAVGATAVLDPEPPTPKLVHERLVTFRPTLFFAVPSFYAALLAADVPPEAFEPVRLAVSAGEPLPPDLYRRFTEKYEVEVIDGIGTTEALHIFMSNRPGHVRPGTTGTPVPGYEVRLVGADGREVEPGTPGSLMVKGESIGTGYWCRTATTRKIFQGEWLRTGDTYTVDADGYYTSLGRTDDMLKPGGIWVAPTEVEARLIEHPAVTYAAVVGLPDIDGLEKPIACVVLAEDAITTAEEILEFCRAGLASYKRPRRVLILDKLPTTATGKIQRFAVREIAASLLS